jgi:hypothetical protein
VIEWLFKLGIVEIATLLTKALSHAQLRDNSLTPLVPDNSVGEVEMDEDHSDEEEAVFLEEEVPSDDESSSGDSIGAGSIDREAEVVIRGRSRIRVCLPGCDCERPYGRKCECERKANGLCSLQCKCDRSKCRTTVKDDSDEEDV